MSLVNRLRTHYGWTCNFQLESKKPAHQGHNSGWIVLSHENNQPRCSWISKTECTQLPIVLDERLFGDTIFKVERTSSNTYNILDVWMYNSSCIYAGTTFKQRSEWLDLVLKMFHNPILTKLTHSKPNKVIILKTAIPDVYSIKGEEGYVQIPDLKTSKFMRSKGSEFKLNCEKQGEYWIIQENIPDLK